jgi:signal transduction histidine kinase/DNA-binding response OmpR family regulator
MKYLAQILALVEEGSNIQEQLHNILTFIVDYLKLKSASISGVYKKRRLINDDNPEGYYLKLITTVGEITPRDKFRKEPYQSIDHYTIPISYKNTTMGQICFVGNVDQTAIDELKIIFWFIGMIMYYNNIDNEYKTLREEKELSKAKSMFMANVSHEIRTPLNAILGCLDYFTELDLPRSGTEVLEVMKHSSYNLLYLVNDILDISGLESDKMTIHLSPVQLNDIVADAYKIVHDTKPARVTFQSFIESDVPNIVITDSQRLKQVIINLLSNAFKFTEQGHVKLRICAASSDDLEALDLPDITQVSLTPNNSPRSNNYTYRKNMVEKERKGSKKYIKISVSDTGIGIKERDISKLFQSFSQIDSSTTKKYSGTGLGLAISSGLCKLLQGGISLISEWKKGSTFYFVIPVQEYLQEQELKIDLGLLKGKNVLIVDDKVDNIVRLTNILDKYEITYQTTTNAKHAIASFINNKKYTFDLGMLDVYMPEMDGNQLAEYISKTDRPFPLIALSSANTKLNDITGSFDLTLSKPYSEEQLLHSMHSILNSRNKAKSINKTKDDSRSSSRSSSRSGSRSNSEKSTRYIINKIKSKHKDNESKSTAEKSNTEKTNSDKKSNTEKTNSDKKSISDKKSKRHRHRSKSLHESSTSSSEFKANTNIEINILVVEDNEYNQFTMKRMLNSLGYYNIDMASSGPDALAMVQNNKDVLLKKDDKYFIERSKYDVILMDVIMPGMDGITTARRIKRLFKADCAPLIYAVTANVVPGFDEDCKIKGHMDGFISKPIDKKILADYLSRLPKEL